MVTLAKVKDFPNFSRFTVLLSVFLKISEISKIFKMPDLHLVGVMKGVF